MKLFINILLVFLSYSTLMAQDKSDLQKRKQKLLEEIEFSNEVLQQTQKDKNLSYNQLKTLNQKISIRSQLIRTIQNELRSIKEEIRLTKAQNESLQIELDSLKIEYAQLIKQAYNSSRYFNRLLFLFSSSDFQQAYKRATYIRQIAQYRKAQSQNIEQKQLTLEGNILVLRKQHSIKQDLIENKRLENEMLNQEQTQQSASLAALSEKEKELKKVLDQKQKKRKKIQKEIERIIAEELRKANNTGLVNNFAATPEAIALSNNFAANKGKLPWPVAKGLVISKFGKQKHPILTGVTIENNGIEIATEQYSPCRSVFDGKVSSVLVMPNGTKVVMVRHGEYISVYSNLSEVYVEKGELINTKDHLGLVFTSLQERSTIIDFQLWKSAQKLNPQSWLMNK